MAALFETKQSPKLPVYKPQQIHHSKPTNANIRTLSTFSVQHASLPGVPFKFNAESVPFKFNAQALTHHPGPVYSP